LTDVPIKRTAPPDSREPKVRRVDPKAGAEHAKDLLAAFEAEMDAELNGVHEETPIDVDSGVQPSAGSQAAIDVDAKGAGQDLGKEEVKTERPGVLPVKTERAEVPDVVMGEVKQELKGAPQVEVKAEVDRTGRSTWHVGRTVVQTTPMKTERPGGDTQITVRKEPDGSVPFYFLDAYEEPYADPPLVVLFGKVQDVQGEYHSACLNVIGMKRNVFFVLRQRPEEPMDQEKATEVAGKCVEEIDQLRQHRFSGVKDMEVNLVRRNYAFERTGVPHGEIWVIKASYPATQPVVPEDVRSGVNFSHIFGQKTSLLEMLIRKKGIMGPSWLSVKGGVVPAAECVSHCRFEMKVDSHKEITVLPEGQLALPPLCIMSLAMKTIQRTSSQAHEICQVSCFIKPNANLERTAEAHLRENCTTFCAVRSLEETGLPPGAENTLPRNQVKICSNEKGLLNLLVAQIRRVDPDVIVGHNIYGFDLDLLTHRLSSLRVPTWHGLSRLRRGKGNVRNYTKGGDQSGQQQGRWLTIGRLVCDTMLLGRDMVAARLSAYDLTTVCATVLGDGTREELPSNEVIARYDTAQQLQKMIEHTTMDAALAIRVAWRLQMLQLTKQLTNIAGNLWHRSLTLHRAERNEYLLLHTFHRKKFLCPDKSFGKKVVEVEDQGGLFDAPQDAPTAGKGPRRKKAEYSGGMVLEPKAGLYDGYVMSLDFNSLYPSIIMEYNVCFTTVERKDQDECIRAMENGDNIVPDVATVDKGDSVLPAVIRKLVETRKAVRQAQRAEKNPEKRELLNTKQLACKLMANSMYGCLGFSSSRFYAKPIAALITSVGRSTLASTIELVTDTLGLDVVYGDTDSIFVNSRVQDYKTAIQLGEQIKKEVNRRYKTLVIEIEDVYRRLLLLKKKKYAGIVASADGGAGKRIEKGLDLVRRDWCRLSKTTGKRVLDFVLGDDPAEDVPVKIHEHLEQVAQAMDERSVELSEYVITKAITKMPADYADKNSQPHVQVALRMQQRGEPVRPQLEIAYVICDIEGENNVAQRARHPSEMHSDPSLKVDVAWYKKTQIHPPILRLVASVPGTDAARLAEALGLDGTQFVRSEQAATINLGQEHADLGSLFDNKEDRFREFQELTPFACLQCKGQLLLRDLARSHEASDGRGGFKCLNQACGLSIPAANVSNAVCAYIKSLLDVYSMAWRRCEEPTCGHRSREVVFQGTGRYCGFNGCSGLVLMEMPERKVFEHLTYLRWVLGEAVRIDAARNAMDAPLRSAQRAVENCIRLSAYNKHDCEFLFGFMSASR